LSSRSNLNMKRSQIPEYSQEVTGKTSQEEEPEA